MLPHVFRFLLVAGIYTTVCSGCLKDTCTRTDHYVRYDPVYLSEKDIRTEVSVESPRKLRHPGNLYFYRDYLLINEQGEGIHVIDNHDPSNPVPLVFIRIPGSRDIAVRNDILYADMYIDLVAVDISDVIHPNLVCRVENVFEDYYAFVADRGFIVEYVATDVIEEIDCSDADFGSGWMIRDDALWVLNAFQSGEVFDATLVNTSQSGSAGAPGQGIAGSMARFALAKEHLYTLDIFGMEVFGLTEICPEKKNTIAMQWGIETLFPYGDYLFVGSNSGMLIYDNHDPSSPAYLSQFRHAQACDPVFVSNDIAYVTLRDGTTCQNFINQLDVIDVSDIRNPRLIKTHPMEHPHGLSVVDQTLYLCEGSHGLKVFDASDHLSIAQNLLSRVDGIHAYDVIVLPQQQVAMVIGQDGLYQYDVSDSRSLIELSRIPIFKN